MLPKVGAKVQTMQNDSFQNTDMFRYYEEWWQNRNDPRFVVFEKLDRLVANRLELCKGARAMDIGAGFGKLTGLLKGHFVKVVCVEPNPRFCSDMRRRLPGTQIIQSTIQDLAFDNVYDLCTMIQVTQNIDGSDLPRVIDKIARSCRRLHVNISNSQSFHGRWITTCGFKKSFVHMSSVQDFERMLTTAGFRIIYRAGVGLLTPVTARDGFKWKIVPNWAACCVNILDRYFTRWCHFVYYECVSHSVRVFKEQRK
jgi:SAM-dependent methyltransferase